MSRFSRIELTVAALGAGIAALAYPLQSSALAYCAALLAVASLTFLVARLLIGPDERR
jgi:hypothetical protein